MRLNDLKFKILCMTFLGENNKSFEEVSINITIIKSTM